ncbi:MAG: hypothetical protein OXT09_29390 [Myxococcales bacterium]|nr:hypothetical protein [Myxococcales bacterium]
MLLQAAERNLDRAKVLTVPRFEPVLLATQAGLANVRGDGERAQHLIAMAIECCVADSTCQRESYRYALAHLRGPEAAEAKAQAAARLHAAGVEDPRYIIAGVYPGLIPPP